jgi:hypothetical protein
MEPEFEIRINETYSKSIKQTIRNSLIHMLQEASTIYKFDHVDAIHKLVDNEYKVKNIKSTQIKKTNKNKQPKKSRSSIDNYCDSSDDTDDDDKYNITSLVLKDKTTKQQNKFNGENLFKPKISSKLSII